MAHKEDQSIYVITFPLRTEKWQEDRIDKMMRLLTVFYNEKQKALVEKWLHISKSKEYLAKKTESSINSVISYMRDYGYSEYGLKEFFKDKNQTDSPLITHGLNSCILRNLAKAAWSAWEKKLSEKRKNIFIKTDKEVNIIKSDYISWKDRRTGEKKGNILGFDVDLEHLSITMYASKPHRHSMFTLPFVVNRESDYEAFAIGEMHQDRTKLRNIAIVRKQIRGKAKYYVQFSIFGTPYNKGRKLGRGVVGIDPGPGKIAVVSDQEVKVITLAESIVADERETHCLQRKLDRSRRATNPDNYNEDGTIKRGVKLHFEKSESYKRTQARLADMQRKLAAKRKIAHNKLANELLAMGNEFRVEDNNFKSWQARAKETTYDKKGRCRAKSRYGKSIGRCAPSEFFTILKNKVNRLPNGVYVDIPDSIGCTAFDFTNGEFTKHHPRERTITTSDGHEHDRDALAAFNMKFVRTEELEDKKKVEKSKKNFDNISMADFYPKFCRMEKRMKK